MHVKQIWFEIFDSHIGEVKTTFLLYQRLLCFTSVEHFPHYSIKMNPATHGLISFAVIMLPPSAMVSSISIEPISVIPAIDMMSFSS